MKCIEITFHTFTRGIDASDFYNENILSRDQRLKLISSCEDTSNIDFFLDSVYLMSMYRRNN